MPRGEMAGGHGSAFTLLSSAVPTQAGEANNPASGPKKKWPEYNQAPYL